MNEDDSDYELDLDRLLPVYEGDIVEEGDKGGAAKNILDKRSNKLNATSQKIRSEVLPQHLQGKFRTIVCRHWLNGSCMKGDSCEFLHRKDADRMPDCRFGLKCPNKDNGKCPFKHVEAEKTCSFYSQGFCPEGRACNSEHNKKTISELPIIGDFTLGIESTVLTKSSGKENWYASDAELAKRRDAGPNTNYKTNMCKHFMQTGGPDDGGVCPWGDDCHFAHGPNDLRSYETMKQRQIALSQRGGQGGRAALGPLPEGFALRDDEEPYRLFMLKCNSIQNLARSLQQKVWRVKKDIAPLLNEAFYAGDKVLLLFSQVGTMQVQGCATMLSPIPESTYKENKTTAITNDDNEDDVENMFSGHFGVSWDRGEGCMRECSMEQNLDDLPNLMQYCMPCSLAGDGQEISATPEVGGKLLRRLWNSPEPTLEFEPYMADTPLDMESEARCARDGGFVFATPTNKTAGESYEKKMLGCGESMQFEVAFVQAGTPCFLMNSSTQCIVFGILSCESEYPTLIDGDFLVHSLGLNNQRGPSPNTPAKLQIKYKQILNCKPLKCDDEELLRVLGRDKPLSEGALTAPETVRLMEVLARRQYLSNVATYAKELAAKAMQAQLEAQAAQTAQTQIQPLLESSPEKKMRVA